MAWYNFWKKKNRTVEVPAIFTLTPSPTQVTAETQVQRNEFRNGMWVVTSKGIGIIFEFDPKNHNVLVHLVDEKTGGTVNALIVDKQQLRQAKLSEIPESRKRGMTYERAKYLGYM